MDKTKLKIIEMLKENTGKALCDSGDYYGRHYEKNKSLIFDNTPEVVINCFKDELMFTKSLYHFLIDCVNIDDDSEKLQKIYSNRYKKSEESYYQDMCEFKEYIENELNAKGIYGEGKPFMDNTANGESCLSQELHYLFFSIDGEDYILLQIHGGCDIRGGYTEPYLFKCDMDCFINHNNLDIYFKDNTSIRTDDGYNWYDEDCGHVVIEQVDGEPDENPKKIKVNGKIKEMI